MSGGDTGCGDTGGGDTGGGAARLALWVSALQVTDDPAAAALGRDCARNDIRSLWISGRGDNSALRLFGRVIGSSDRTRVASAVASLWATPAAELAAWALGLIDAYGPQRLLAGIGVSHAPSVARAGLGVYRQPYQLTSGYLSALSAAGLPGSSVVLGAQGPAMLRLAGRRAGGAHPYLVTPEHTAAARAALGPALLVPEQTVILERSAGPARAIGREFLATYLRLPNYVNSWRRLGFDDSDFADGGSDRLIDRILVWGSPDDAADRVREHVAAGADEVAVRFLPLETAPVAAYLAVRSAL
jgi:probable F420-dependent oxidoreductase